MTKKQRLDTIEELVEIKMIEFLKSGETERLTELATPANYVAKNNRIEEKQRGSLEEDIQKRIKEAEKRRKNV